jgi:hypothetical protein
MDSSADSLGPKFFWSQACVVFLFFMVWVLTAFVQINGRGS